MITYRVVLVEPHYQGNIGAVARLMRNFGLAELMLVRPPPIQAQALRWAMDGADLLRRATTVDGLNAGLEDVDVVVGTTGLSTAVEKRFLRQALTPAELAERLRETTGRVALLFGREDFGLLNRELATCDLLVTVPTDPASPILNVSHAAAIILYELCQASPARRLRTLDGTEKETLHSAFDDLLHSIGYPAHRRERTRVMFRRLMGRALPSKWEFHALMGVLARAAKRIRRLEDAPPLPEGTGGP